MEELLHVADANGGLAVHGLEATESSALSSALVETARKELESTAETGSESADYRASLQRLLDVIHGGPGRGVRLPGKTMLPDATARSFFQDAAGLKDEAPALADAIRTGVLDLEAAEPQQLRELLVVADRILAARRERFGDEDSTVYSHCLGHLRAIVAGLLSPPLPGAPPPG